VRPRSGVIPGGQILRVPDQGFRRRPKNQFYEGPEIGIACKQSQGKDPFSLRAAAISPLQERGSAMPFATAEDSAKLLRQRNGGSHGDELDRRGSARAGRVHRRALSFIGDTLIRRPAIGWAGKEAAIVLAVSAALVTIG